MIKVTNPANGELIQEIESDSKDLVQQKFDTAREVQSQWYETPLSDRVKSIERFDQALEENLELLALKLTREMGKPIVQSENEIKAVSKRIRFFTKNVESALKPETPPTSKKGTEEISYEPLGVVGNISAWNYPYFVGSNVFIPALLTGNTVLYKPSEHAVLTGMAIGDLMHESGIPKEVFQVVIGEGATGAQLLKMPLDAMFFTGSYATGKKISQEMQKSKFFPKVQMELGGKDPAYVCDDVDIRTAAEALADGAFYNAGQSCCSVERIYVHGDIYDAFCQRFVDVIKGFQVGDPLERDTYIGPLARKPQLKILKDQIADAKKQGGTIALGGEEVKDSTGFFFQPTVVTHTNSKMKLMREESFGPIIGIESVVDDEEALSRMNDTEFGLTSAVYTKEEKRARSLMRRLHSGSVYWNCCDRISPTLPWTGRRQSGIGSTLSMIGIRAFTQPKAWHLKR